MKRPRQSKFDTHAAASEIGALISRVRRLIWGVGVVLVFFFAWLQFSELPIVEILENTRTDLLLRVFLAIYYACWIFGTGFDLSIQQAVYVNDPHRGRMPFESYAVILSFGVIAVVLVWSSQDYRYFLPVLATFLLGNILGWAYIVRRVSGIIRNSRAYYKSQADYFGLEKLDVVTEYMLGNWQKWRFGLLCAIAAIGNALVLIPALRQSFVALLGAVSGASPSSIDRILPEAIFALFVIASEGWIMTMRLQARLAMDTIDRLRPKYNLAQRR